MCLAQGHYGSMNWGEWELNCQPSSYRTTALPAPRSIHVIHSHLSLHLTTSGCAHGSYDWPLWWGSSAVEAGGEGVVGRGLGNQHWVFLSWSLFFITCSFALGSWLPGVACRGPVHYIINSVRGWGRASGVGEFIINVIPIINCPHKFSMCIQPHGLSPPHCPYLSHHHHEHWGWHFSHFEG